MSQRTTLSRRNNAERRSDVSCERTALARGTLAFADVRNPEDNIIELQRDDSEMRGVDSLNEAHLVDHRDFTDHGSRK